MTYHVRSHEGGITKPYTCSVCGKGFSRYCILLCFFIMVFGELQVLCALDVYVRIDVGRPVLLEEIGDR